MALARENDEHYMLPRRFSDLEKWVDDPSMKHRGQPKVVEKLESPAKQEVLVSTSGPRNGGLLIPEGASGWNAGDIDFRHNGAIFIRNPYLADAIERHLQAASRKAGVGQKFLKIVRDEGWSGSETNVVC